MYFFSNYSSEESDFENNITNDDDKIKETCLSKPDSFRNVPGPDDISQTLDEVRLIQPILKKYPKTIYGVGRTKRARSFNSNWYEFFKWLEYSKNEDSVCCFPCSFFYTKSKNNLDTNYKSIGYKNWKNAMSAKGFPGHDRSEEHKQCSMSWIDYKKNLKNITSVLSQISD